MYRSCGMGPSTNIGSLPHGRFLTRLSGLFGPRRTGGLNHNQHVTFFNCARRVLIEREHTTVVDQPDDEHARNRIRHSTDFLRCGGPLQQRDAPARREAAAPVRTRP
jgi:hypothetical protein